MKITKKQKREILKISNDLPPMKEYYRGRKSVSGKDLISGEAKHNWPIESNGEVSIKEIVYDNKKDTQKIDPEKDYLIPSYNQRPVNHKKRLNSAFQSNGWDGVMEYVKPYIKTKEEQNAQ